MKTNIQKSPNDLTLHLILSLFIIWSKQKWLFGGPTFIQPIRTIWNVFKKPWLAGKKADPPKKPPLFWSCKQAN